jgi:hypothetical protein
VAIDPADHRVGATAAEEDPIDFGLYTILLVERNRPDVLKLVSLVELLAVASRTSDPAGTAQAVRDACAPFLSRVRRAAA